MSYLSRVRGRTRDGLKSAIGPALSLAGLHLLSRDQTERLLDERGTDLGGGLRTLTVGEGGVQRIDLLRSGVARIDRRTFLDLDYGNRSVLLDGAPGPSIAVERAIALWSHRWTNYFHWVVDILPKLCIALAALGSGLDGHQLCYPGWDVPYEWEYLDLLGIDASSVTDTRAFRSVSVTRTLATIGVPGWAQVPPAITTVRERLAERGTASAGPNIYVSRVGRRMVRNEGAVVAELSRWGFEFVADEPRSVTDQIGLFRDASLIVAPHGAALANLVWCRPGTTVIELLPAGYRPRYIPNLARTLGLHHHALVEGSAHRDRNHWSAVGDDMIVDVRALSGVLDSLVRA